MPGVRNPDYIVTSEEAILLSRLAETSGDAYAKKGQHDRAIADYSDAIRLDPKSASAFQSRGLAWRHKGKRDWAIADFNEAIRLDPESAGSYYARGDAYAYNTQYDPAIADFDDAIRLDPKNADYFFARGIAYEMKGQHARAIIDFDEAIRLSPNFALAIEKRARIVAMENELGGKAGKTTKPPVNQVISLDTEIADNAGVATPENETEEERTRQADLDAQCNLGLMYEQGRGVPRDDVAAAVLYRKVAEQGHAHGQCNLGFMYEQGRGVPQDDAAAAIWYRKAADRGHDRAQCNLGFFYSAGRGGLPQDECEAARLFKVAAEHGNACGQRALGFSYDQGLGGLPQDYCEAARLYKLAADQGDACAQANLGVYYEQGRGGLPKNKGEATRLYKLAADQGDARGQAALTRLNQQKEQKKRPATAISINACTPAEQQDDTQFRQSSMHAEMTDNAEDALARPTRGMRTAFWWLFFLVPLFTGILQYHWLPNESYDADRYELLSSHEVCRDEVTCGEMADVWRDKKTGKIFSRADFSIHRHEEAIRMPATWFAYGLIGCFAFGYFRRQKSEHAFFTYFGMAACVNLLVAIFTYLSIL